MKSKVEAEAFRNPSDRKIVWITGLPGSGKTTFAKKLVNFAKTDGLLPIFLDGDELRTALMISDGFDREKRINLAKTYFNLAILLSNQGYLVVVSTVSMFADIFELLSEEIGVFVVLIDAPKKVIFARNQKGLYSGSQPNVPGISLKIQFPQNPYLKLNGQETDQQMSKVIRSLLKDISS